MITVLVVIGAIVVVGGIAMAVVGGYRSRSAKSDWLGELSDIRRSSLGDDEEVTGALEAIHVGDDEATDEDTPPDEQEPVIEVAAWPEPEPEPEPESPAEAAPAFADAAERSSSAATVPNLHSVTDAPDRTVEDGGAVFREYDRPGSSLLRIEATDPDGLRVLVGGSDEHRATCAVDLRRGVLWHLAAQNVIAEACSIRTPAGWVTTTGTMLVMVDATGWSYAMCLDGVATVEVSAEGHQARLEAGQIGRGRNGTVGFELADVGVDALESEGAVRRQRRLDHTGSFRD
jgi:hypothetical protein